QTFEVFIQNSCDISSESKKIHGIREVDLVDAKTTMEAIPEFLEFIGSRPLVGYYLEFDIAMINKYVKPMYGIILPNETIEVSEIYYNQKIKFIPQGNIDLRFDTILQNCKIPNMGAHNAVNDAIMTAMIYLKLKDKER
ncbi:MAG: exonuclease domain-containing protein, partial [Campylobacterota bacterium]|nr:exonuclease domain-containing protein [Campylobacterota bacterium]